MIERPVWHERLVAAWKQASIVWLTGPAYERVQDGLKVVFLSPGELRQALT